MSLCLFHFACSGQSAGTGKDSEKKPLIFELPSVPSIVTDPSQRAEYLVAHYWDNFDFTRKEYTEVPEVTEQAFANYIDILKLVPYDQAVSSIKGMLTKAEADSTVFNYFTGLYEKYLYEPNSPFLNEEYFIPALEVMVNSDLLDNTAKVRPAYLLELAQRNRVNQPATDFVYTLPDGRTANLYGIKADYTLLYFYNPDCHACKEVSDELKASPLVNGLIDKGQLKILAVYPDQELDAWKRHLSEYPATWINSYDGEVIIKDEEIYDLKAIPTMYLLDKDKKVILKDFTYTHLENYFRGLNQ
ncbi:MAG: DUF5106 domain-containing protein [Tannerellaceae bacterium]|nr:DUF5106 domain-containing protein [Tannerellaceae bacterium]